MFLNGEVEMEMYLEITEIPTSQYRTTAQTLSSLDRTGLLGKTCFMVFLKSLIPSPVVRLSIKLKSRTRLALTKATKTLIA